MRHRLRSRPPRDPEPRSQTSEAGDAAAFYERLGYRQTDRRVDRDGRTIIAFDHIPGER